MSYPTKEERSQCWGARDRYWVCLDEHKIDNPAKDGPCGEFRKIYENSCSIQWVKHFDRKRNYLKFKDKIEKEGYEPLDQRANAKQTYKIPSSPKIEKSKSIKRRVYHEIACLL